MICRQCCINQKFTVHLLLYFLPPNVSVGFRPFLLSVFKYSIVHLGGLDSVVDNVLACHLCDPFSSDRVVVARPGLVVFRRFFGFLNHV